MSELKVDKITPRLGTTLTLGDSGDTINFGSGVLPNFENLTVTGDLTVDTNSLKVDSTNNFVGIGTASPSVALDVVGAITATGNITGTLATASQPNITSVGTMTGLTVDGIVTVDRVINATTSADPWLKGVNGSNTETSFVKQSGDAYFGGNVGIGTNSPVTLKSSTTLQVYGNAKLGDDNARGLLSLGDIASSGANAGIWRGSPGAYAGTGNYLNLGGYDGIAFTTGNADIASQTERMRINSSGNVGIGTSSPSSLLELSNSSGNTTLQMTSVDGGNTTIQFGDVSDASRGTIQYNNTSEYLRFTVNNLSEAMRIDSSGNVLVGKTSSATSGTGAEFRQDGLGVFGRSGDYPLILNRTTSDGGIALFRKDGATVGSINAKDGDIAIGTNDTALRFSDSTASLYPFNNTTNAGRDNAVDLGLASVKWKDGYFGGTITFADSHKLQNDVFDNLQILASSGEGMKLTTQSNSDVVFETNNNERMRVTGTGNVGIGTTSPDSILDLTSTPNNNFIHFNSTTGGLNGDIIGGFEVNNTGGTIGKITVHRESTNSSGYIAFQTATTEKMRINNSGNVFIAKTTDSITTVGHYIGSNGAVNHVRDNTNVMAIGRKTSDGTLIQFYRDSTQAGVIGARSSAYLYIGSGDTGLLFQPNIDAIEPWSPSAGGSGGSRDNAIDFGTSSNRFDDIYATSGTVNTSDQNEKNTITDSDLGLDFVNRLTPKSYIFNGKTRTHYGLIAQEVETVLSDISKTSTDFAGFIKSDISEEQDGSEYRYGLRYHEFIAPMIKAIQELKADNDALRARIEALENA